MENVFKKAIVLTSFALVFSVVPAQAQGWVKAGKSAVKAAEKAISKNGSKAVKSVTKNGSKAAKQAGKQSGINSNSIGRAGAVASQHVKTEKCPSCSGTGVFYYNGYRYTCQSCNGTGTKISAK